MRKRIQFVSSAGTNIKDNRTFRNIWTAVHVLGQWRFVNVCWGARYLLRSYSLGHQSLNATSASLNALGALNSSIAQNTQNTIRVGGFPAFKCDNFYFLTDPEKHIYEHLPDRKEWQLLRHTLRMEDFLSLPVLKSNFFNAGLELKKRYTETLDTRGGRVQVVLNMQRFVGLSSTLLCREDMSEVKGISLIRTIADYAVVSTEPPKMGKYLLNVYVAEDWKQDAFQGFLCFFHIFSLFSIAYCLSIYAICIY